MFSEKQIVAYRNIKAPDELRNKITNSSKNKFKTLYFISAMAACLILVSSIILNNQNSIIINGQKLNDTIVFYDTTSSHIRTVSHSISVPVEIKTSNNTKISVSNGYISIDGSNPNSEIEIDSSKVIWWEIELKTSENVFEMKISDKKGVKLVTLKYDNAKIIVSKEKEK